MKAPVAGWQVSANFCQDRCADIAWCKKFTWYPEKGPTGEIPGACWLFDDEAVEIQNDFTSVSGPPECADGGANPDAIVPVAQNGSDVPTGGSEIMMGAGTDETKTSGPVWPWLLVGLVCVLAVIGGGIVGISFLQKKGEKKKTTRSVDMPLKEDHDAEKALLVEEPPSAFPQMAPEPPPSYTPIQTAVSPIPMYTAVPVNTAQGVPLIMAPAVRSDGVPLQQAQVVPLVWAQEQPTVMATQPLVRHVQATPMTVASPVLGGSLTSPVLRAGT